MNAYEQKIEARKERLLARAEKLDKIAAARFKAVNDTMSMIPLGQPILVGHHSEKRHRRDLERMDANMRKSIAAQEAAGRARAAAESAGTAGISSDDPDAVQKLEARISDLEKSHELMVKANACLRKKDDAGLAALGFTPAQIEAAKKPDVMGCIGFPSYRLQNSSANIRRLKDRVAHLKRAATRETKERDMGLFRMVENVEDNRLQLIFPGKPSADVRTRLKQSGFRWAPSNGAWQRHLSQPAIWQAEQIAKELAA